MLRRLVPCNDDATVKSSQVFNGGLAKMSSWFKVRTFHNSKLIIIMIAISHCTYHFTCLREHITIEKNKRTTRSRVMEYVHRWLHNLLVSIASRNVRSNQLCSLIPKHIIKTGHNIDLNTTFNMLYEDCYKQVFHLIEVLGNREIQTFFICT